MPDPAEVETLITDKTRALVVINPNNPTGAVYSREVLQVLAGIAERHHLVFCAHEIYDEVLDAVGRSQYLSVMPPRGAMYGFIRVHAERLPGGLAAFDDQAFALDLLQQKHVLVAPGSSFNVPYRDHFRVTLLPDADEIADVFGRIESLLDDSMLS